MTTDAEVERFLAERAEPVERIRNSEDVVVAKVGRDLYEKFFRGYTRKQWRRDPSELHSSVLRADPDSHQRATTATSPTRFSSCRSTATRRCSAGSSTTR